MIQPVVTDLCGRTQTWFWLLQTFGDVTYHAAAARRGQPVYRITRLHASVTGNLLTALVLDEEGRPLPRVRIVRAWTEILDMGTCSPPGRPVGAPAGLQPPDGDVRDPAPHRVPNPAALADAIALTDERGLAEFPTGPGDDYRLPPMRDRRRPRGDEQGGLPAAGRSTLWIADPGIAPWVAGPRQGEGKVPSDAIEGVGILQSDLGLRLCLHITWKRMQSALTAPDARPSRRATARGKGRRGDAT